MNLIFYLPLLLLACTPTICNVPYMNFEKSCCLDQNNNSICDFDDKIVNSINQTIISPITIEKIDTLGINLSKSLNEENYSLLYSLLTDNFKSEISEEDFISFFPSIKFGVYRAYDDGGNLIVEHPDKTNFKKNILSSESETEIELSFFNGSSYEDRSYEVRNEKIDDFEEVVYGCLEVSDCKKINVDVCEKTCIQDNKFSSLRLNDSFICRDNQCQCLCELNSDGAKLIIPKWDLIN